MESHPDVVYNLAAGAEPPSSAPMEDTMQLLAIFLALSSPAAAEEKPTPELVKVYCFSEDLEAGFQDMEASYFCKELGKRGKKKKSLTLVQSRETTDVVVNYLGTQEFTARGETTFLAGGYAWTPSQSRNGSRAVLNIGDYTKGFYGEGINAQSALVVWSDIEAWIRENRETILAKVSGQ